jgi:signal peptidase I
MKASLAPKRELISSFRGIKGAVRFSISMSRKKKNMYIYLSKVILVTLLIILCVRTFLIEPYTISSSLMETSLLKGDKVFIDKTSYGIRLPMTILTIPFTFDNILGRRSYSTAIEAPYKRLFEKSISRNDIVLFNNPMEADKPLDKKSLIVSRCVALPGDTIRMEGGTFSINNIKYTDSPDVMAEYTIDIPALQDVKEIMEEQDIPVRNLQSRADMASMRLNKLEAFIINENLPDSVLLRSKTDTIQAYQLVIPFKGKIINIDAANITIYRQAIVSEQGDKAEITEDKLIIDGKEQTRYTFEDDYYWVLSDNTENAMDSRSLGFIPFRNVIGKVHYIRFSSDNGNIGKECCFTSVN